MYTSKKFKARIEKDVFAEIDEMKTQASDTRKVFLADGNAFVLSFSRLMNIIERLNNSFPKLNRVSAYALPSDIISKSEQELKQLADAGLKLLYVGIESGDDELLKVINKSETYNSTVEALVKARKAGIKLSVMILNGLGGLNFTEQHALNSAKVINEIQPEYLSTLVLSHPYGVDHFKQKFKGEFIELSKLELIQEMRLFIDSLELNNTVFRSDHASNYLILKGILNRDKDELIQRIGNVLDNPDQANLRPEYLRGL
jgi:radical SAM superfamily enzyme YgiQ (UPF0313 family)